MADRLRSVISAQVVAWCAVTPVVCAEDVPVEPITATYTRVEGQFRVEVTGHGQSRTGTAPDIVAARELAGQLAARLTPATGATAVIVHLLDGSGVAFTRALLAARLGLTPPP